jgi:hypothetical protein
VHHGGTIHASLVLAPCDVHVREEEEHREEAEEVGEGVQVDIYEGLKTFVEQTGRCFPSPKENRRDVRSTFP